MTRAGLILIVLIDLAAFAIVKIERFLKVFKG